MRLGIEISQHQLTWSDLLRRARFAEDCGFDSTWVFDHFKALYGDPAGPCMEAWTLLAALAASTGHIRLGTLVTGVTYRHPSILASEAVTVDHISDGRLNLGIGAAWYEEEHRQLGIDFPPVSERVGRLDEALTVIKSLLSGEKVTFSGRYYRLEEATYAPRPVQRPHPPIWVGAGGPKLTLPLAARHADVWHGFGSASELAGKAAILDEHALRIGRDPAEIARSTSLSLDGTWEEIRATAEELRAGGFSHLIVSWPTAGQGRVEEFVERLMPDLSAD